jgi:hypothetical protein
MLALVAAIAAATPALATPKSGQERLELARMTARALNPIYRALPTLSPAEQTWVDNELRAALQPGGGSRIDSLTQTREYQIRQARRWLGPADAALTILLQGKSPKQAEVLQWAELLDNLMPSDLYWVLDRLVERRVLPAAVVHGGKNAADNAFFLKSAVASTIVSDIIIPFLANELPD